jgi:hypothetical protein
MLRRGGLLKKVGGLCESSPMYIEGMVVKIFE